MTSEPRLTAFGVWMSGALAAKEGAPLKGNPYAANTLWAKGWAEGWEAWTAAKRPARKESHARAG